MENTKKLKKPCGECPFRKKNKLVHNGKPGGSHPEVYVGQSEGPFWLPCHSDKAYADKNSDHKVVQQCAGAAIYRSNIGVSEKMPDAIHILPEDKKLVFESHADFVSHYSGVHKRLIKRVLSPKNVKALMYNEMHKLEVKILNP